MEEASKIALLSAFGGVLIGGFITYLSESHFRRRERELKIRRDFQICLHEVSKAVNELTSIYHGATELLPETKPDLLAFLVRRSASMNITYSHLDSDRLFSINHSKDEMVSDVSLFFQRFHDTLNLFKVLSEEKLKVQERWSKEAISVPTNTEDIATIKLDFTDSKIVRELVVLENLHRDFFKNLIKDIREGRDIICRLNVNSKRKFQRWHNKKYPKLFFREDFTPLPYLENMPFFSPSDFIEKHKS